MSVMVTLYSSSSLSGQEFLSAMQAAGEGYITQEGSGFTGAVWDGERTIFLYGDWEAPNPVRFWQTHLQDKKNLPEIEAKLGGRPASSIDLQIGKLYGSDLLAVELAYQCMLRWPCVVLADTWDPVEGDQFVRVYDQKDVERLRRERTTFTTTTPIMRDDEEE